MGGSRDRVGESQDQLGESRDKGPDEAAKEEEKEDDPREAATAESAVSILEPSSVTEEEVSAILRRDRRVSICIFLSHTE